MATKHLNLAGKAGGPAPRDEKTSKTEKVATAAIDEARMVLPGIQALFGFQLIAVFNQPFRGLAPHDQMLHYIAMVLVAVAVAVIMTPAAYHRLAEQGSISRFFVHLASLLIAIAMVPLMVAICIEVYLLGTMILGARWLSISVAVALFAIFAILWFVFPLAMRARKA